MTRAALDLKRGFVCFEQQSTTACECQNMDMKKYALQRLVSNIVRKAKQRRQMTEVQCD